MGPTPTIYQRKGGLYEPTFDPATGRFPARAIPRTSPAASEAPPAKAPAQGGQPGALPTVCPPAPAGCVGEPRTA